MTPPLYYSCHQLLSSLSLSFTAFQLYFSLSHPFPLSLNHVHLFSLSLSSIPIHLFPYCALSPQIFHSPHLSRSSVCRLLTSYPSLYLPPTILCLYFGAFSIVMVHSFISASHPETLCLCKNIRNTYFGRLKCCRKTAYCR